jgi:hypothetical protein
MKQTEYKNFTISGSHRNRESYVIDPKASRNESILFVIEREQDYFLSHKAGCSYFVRRCAAKQGSFMAESWREVIAKLNDIFV